MKAKPSQIEALSKQICSTFKLQKQPKEEKLKTKKELGSFCKQFKYPGTQQSKTKICKWNCSTPSIPK